MAALDELWSYIEEQFHKTMTPMSYTTWIEQATPRSLENNVFEVQVNDSLHKEYWDKNLVTKVIEFAYAYNGIEINPHISIRSDQDQDPVVSACEAAVRAEIPRGDDRLNSRYTFENFIIGKGNQMAHAAALAVSEDPGTLYNPLFLYGGVGLGKTHLMQAIGHQMLATNPDILIKYVTSEDFTNDFINSIRNNDGERFRNEYRNVDLLMVDDVQFFDAKVGTQEEFFHTFNALFDKKKQIVLTSDRLPNEIPTLEERLSSRFKWGLSVDINPPDLETRIAILRSKADNENISAPDDALTYIAGQVDSNVRELEGALLRVKAFAALKHAAITSSLAADALKSLTVAKKDNGLSIRQIQDSVARYYQVEVSDLLGRKRVKQIVMPRQIAMYLAREMTDSSLPKIGKEFGGKDHTTVIHAYEKIETMLKTDKDLKNEVADIRNQLKNRG